MFGSHPESFSQPSVAVKQQSSTNIALCNSGLRRMPLTLKHSSRILSLERVGILGIAHTYRIVSLDDLEKIPGSRSHGEHLGWNPIKDKCRLVYGCICFGKSMFTHSLHVKTEGDMEMVYMENRSLPFHINPKPYKPSKPSKPLNPLNPKP